MKKTKHHLKCATKHKNYKLNKTAIKSCHHKIGRNMTTTLNPTVQGKCIPKKYFILKIINQRNSSPDIMTSAA